MAFDLGDPDTWPINFDTVMGDLAGTVRTWPEVRPDYPCCDLGHHSVSFTDHADAATRAALGDDLFVAHHATRLLNHEADSIRTHGLLPASDDLLTSKLATAQAAHPDLLDDDDLALVARSGPLRWQRGGSRVGLVCVAAPNTTFQDAYGFRNLFADWGGELVGWVDNDQAKAVIARLTACSTPTIVDVAVGAGNLRDTRAVWTIAMGVMLGLQSPWNSWHIQASLGPNRIVGLRTPVDPTWPDTYAQYR